VHCSNTQDIFLNLKITFSGGGTFGRVNKKEPTATKVIKNSVQEYGAYCYELSKQ